MNYDQDSPADDGDLPKLVRTNKLRERDDNPCTGEKDTGPTGGEPYGGCTGKMLTTEEECERLKALQDSDKSEVNSFFLKQLDNWQLMFILFVDLVWQLFKLSLGVFLLTCTTMFLAWAGSKLFFEAGR
ncbi:hypothetical protein AAG570_000693 [Ranatra chinensis]|uniref:Chloride channel CLIC-like protein 1 n=1 Tax=Ranatra chinensis TaxID=642074 RepID=A0ABD0YXS6_9HEMI